MRLVVAEKPSMARAIAEALGIVGKGRSYLQGEVDGAKILVTWCVGHLVEAAEPEVYGAKAWSFGNLPILPDKFQFRPIEQTIDQFQAVRALLQRPDIDEVVNATDAGREGQLIFHLVYDLAGCAKPVWRLWTSSLTDDAIREAWRTLKRDSEYQGLTDAARCRQEADWLVGMNCTRAQTLVARSEGREGVFSIGRVQTPTLAMLVQRELEIAHFVPKDFWTLLGKFRNADGKVWIGKWFRGDDGQQAERPPAGAEPSGDPSNVERLASEDEATALRDRLLGKPARVESVESKKEKRRPELLYDLTALQREANRRFGFTAEHTLEVAQQLYEAQLISYPRTSSRHLTKDDAAKAPAWLAALDRGPYAEFVAEIKGFGKGKVPPLSGRFVDDAQVEDHSGLTVTNKAPRVQGGEIDLPDEQRRLYDLIARRLLAAWYPDRVEQKTTIVTAVDPGDGRVERFRTRGTVVVDPGWSKVDAAPRREKKKPKEADKDTPKDGADADDEDLGELPALKKGEKAELIDLTSKAGKTSPPKAMTEADLLAAMQGAGKLLDDEELRGAMKDSGLGTPATRANMIETLLKRGYAERKGRALVATAKGIGLIQSIQVAELKSPELTGQWEAAMERIRRGQADRPGFMREVHQFVRGLVTGIRVEGQRSAAQHPRPHGDCPECGSALIQRSFGDRTRIACAALAKPDCAFGYDVNADGEPAAGRCTSCQGPLRRDRSERVQCLRCGRTPVADPALPTRPPLMNCPGCRKLLKAVWSIKKSAWLLRCERCQRWEEPPDPSLVGAEPTVAACTACQAPATAVWSAQRRQWLWRCSHCSTWRWVENSKQ